MDGCGIHTGPAFVLHGIGMLEVLEDEINLRNDAPIGVRGREAARLDCELQGRGVLEQGDQTLEEGGLQKRLAAGEGDAATGRLENVCVSKQFRGEVGGGTAFSAEDACALGTGSATAAGTTVDAFLLLEQHLRLGGEPFGIMAPGAAEGTSLEEDSRTDAGSVVETELAYLENDRRRLILHGRSIAQTAGIW